MSTNAKACIRLKFENERQLSILLSALNPETQTMQTTRAEVALQKDGLFLVLYVKAEDTVALRATLNTYLRWIQSTINVIEAVTQQKTKT